MKNWSWWSPEEVDYLKFLLENCKASEAEVGRRLGRTREAVHSKRDRVYGRTAKPTIWTPEVLDSVRSKWDDLKWSTGEIAKVLGPPFTRNMIVGKLYRLGLHGTNADRRTPLVRLPFPSRKGTGVGRPRRLQGYTPPPPAIQVEKPAFCGYSLMDLPPRSCHYPHGDGPFTFCGAEVVDNSPYCGYHLAVCTLQKVYQIQHTRPKVCGVEAPPPMSPPDSAGVSNPSGYVVGGTWMPR